MRLLREIMTHSTPTFLDIESDGLLEEATKIHVVGLKLHNKPIMFLNGSEEKDRIVGMFNYHIDNNIPVVMHNGITFDVPLVEKLLGMDLSNLQVIDTLPLSWYLNVNRRVHGLDSFFEDYGIAKPEIDDWENLTYEEYCHRVKEDVRITQALYEDLIARLYDMYSKSKPLIDEGKVDGERTCKSEDIDLDKLKGLSVEGHINRILSYLSSYEQLRAIQEATGWDVDENLLDREIERLGAIVDSSAKELESVMPKVAKYAKRKPPAKPFKKNGDLSVHGENWDRLKGLVKSGERDEYGNLKAYVKDVGFIEELISLEEPNISSHIQVKDFLHSKGWKPLTFKYVREEGAFSEWIMNKPLQNAPRREWTEWTNSRPEDRAIEQVKDGGELCESVSELAKEIPEIGVLEEYSVVKHRYDTLKGMKERVVNGKVKASWLGLTNTLRCKHIAPCANLPATNRKYAEGIRGSLVAPRGYTSLGSDLSSLENRISHHFMLPLDPKYVETMMRDDYDPHLTTAVMANLVTQGEYDCYISGEREDSVLEARQQGKTTNYALAYFGGVGALVKAGIPKKVAESLYDAYWKLNWSIKAIAEGQVLIKDSKGLEWLVNPINGFLYNVRSEKDIFNTLVQGTGAYAATCWLMTVQNELKKRWGKYSQTAYFHDEVVLVVKDHTKVREVFEEIVVDSVKEVSDNMGMRVELGCDVQFGTRYSEIH